LSKEQGPMVPNTGSTWGRSGGLVNNATSAAFMEIRYRSLGKALDELRTKRVRLEEELRNGHVEQTEYASTLLNLIVETNSVTKEREDVGEKVKALRRKK
jgi:predicted  nucleic acid-binding Zn-ribbon protein